MRVPQDVVLLFIGLLSAYIFLYRYFKLDESSPSETESPYMDTQTSYQPDDQVAVVDKGDQGPDQQGNDEYITCLHCGTVNESSRHFVFCRECDGRLGARLVR